uniref:G-protein coupled receptors family 2 profile 2 domain-containing protein n=2 Tax=Timema TaxID=61471 RepID=A0A7R9H2G6_TIMPO|nr:unnamed protein product [Timema poppensis]
MSGSSTNCLCLSPLVVEDTEDMQLQSISVVTIFPVVAWIILRATKEDTDCWSTDDNGYQWINDGTRITLLAINTLLMADIIRVLLTKLKAVKSWHSDKIRRTVRSTLFLLPLFGVTVLFAAVRPDTTSCAWEQAYYIISYTMDGLQGPMVAILYCYFNREVRMMLKKTYSNMSENFTFLHMGVSDQRIPRTGPRTTSMTNVDDPILDISKMRNSMTESKTINLTYPTNSSSESTHKANFNFNDLFHSSRLSHPNINKPRTSMFDRRSTLASISELRESVEEGSQNDKNSVSDTRFSADNCRIPEPIQTNQYDDSTILSDTSNSNIREEHRRVHKTFDNTWNMFSVDKVPPWKLSNNKSLNQNKDEISKKQSNIAPSKLKSIENDSHSRNETSNGSESFIDINDQTIDEIDTSSQLGSKDEDSSLSEISEIKSRPRVSDKEIEEFGNLYVSVHGPSTTKC